jgi:hypothetical protein
MGAASSLIVMIYNKFSRTGNARADIGHLFIIPGDTRPAGWWIASPARHDIILQKP